MTLLQLKYAVTIASCSTISEAAKRLFLTQPSLTASIKELEQELGITIFSRTNKGVIVTREGEEFLGYARQVIEQTALIEERYFGTAPVRHQFCVSTQHYSFAVEAFVELLKKHGGEEYDFRIRETKTHEIIEDVARLRSEVGVLYLNSFNETITQDDAGKWDQLSSAVHCQTACVCQPVQPAGPKAGRDAGGSGGLSAPFL